MSASDMTMGSRYSLSCADGALPSWSENDGSRCNDLDGVGFVLPVLRSDIELLKAAPAPSGAPVWTLHDPVHSRFYRIGWLQFEMLARWNLANPAGIVKAINRDTTLNATLVDFENLTLWLQEKELFRSNTAKACQMLCSRKQGAKRSLVQRAFGATLFVRKPLLNPDRLLSQCDVLLQPFYRHQGLLTILFGLLVLFGTSSVLAHWQDFHTSFSQFFTPSGFLIFVGVLAFSNVIHECGHGLIAKHYGCRVPVMGVALIFMLPVAYSDTTDAWRLTNRRQKLWINAGGLLAELLVAVFAMIAWVLLPDGIARSLAFFLCISTMASTLLINLNPFMKFDGYYLLADWLQIDNMQSRSFANLRWWLRIRLIGGHDAAPFLVSARKQAIMHVYALSTWLYRIVLYLSIVWMVYTFWFKFMGIVLGVGVFYSLFVKPVFKELLVYWVQIKTESGSWFRRRVTSICGLVVLMLLFVIPLPRQINAPAIISSEDRVRLFSPAALRVQRVLVKVGDHVKTGDVLLDLHDPELYLREAMLFAEMKLLHHRLSSDTGRVDLQANMQISAADIVSKQAELAEVRQAIAKLSLQSSVDGQVVHLAEGAKAGTWTGRNQVLIDVATSRSLLVRAYLPAAAADRIRGSKGYFRSDSDRVVVPVSLRNLHLSSIQQLSDTALAISHGGVIATRSEAGRRKGDPVRQIPLQEWRMAELSPGSRVQIPHEKSGFVSFEAEPKSLLSSGLDRIHGVLLRESGF